MGSSTSSYNRYKYSIWTVKHFFSRLTDAYQSNCRDPDKMMSNQLVNFGQQFCRQLTDMFDRKSADIWPIRSKISRQKDRKSADIWPNRSKISRYLTKMIENQPICDQKDRKSAARKIENQPIFVQKDLKKRSGRAARPIVGAAKNS